MPSHSNAVAERVACLCEGLDAGDPTAAGQQLGFLVAAHWRSGASFLWSALLNAFQRRTTPRAKLLLLSHFASVCEHIPPTQRPNALRAFLSIVSDVIDDAAFISDPSFLPAFQLALFSLRSGTYTEEEVCATNAPSALLQRSLSLCRTAERRSDLQRIYARVDMILVITQLHRAEVVSDLLNDLLLANSSSNMLIAALHFLSYFELCQLKQEHPTPLAMKKFMEVLQRTFDSEQFVSAIPTLVASFSVLRRCPSWATTTAVGMLLEEYAEVKQTLAERCRQQLSDPKLRSVLITPLMQLLTELEDDVVTGSLSGSWNLKNDLLWRYLQEDDPLHVEQAYQLLIKKTEECRSSHRGVFWFTSWSEFDFAASTLVSAIRYQTESGVVAALAPLLNACAALFIRCRVDDVDRISGKLPKRTSSEGALPSDLSLEKQTLAEEDENSSGAVIPNSSNVETYHCNYGTDNNKPNSNNNNTNNNNSGKSSSGCISQCDTDSRGNNINNNPRSEENTIRTNSYNTDTMPQLRQKCADLGETALELVADQEKAMFNPSVQKALLGLLPLLSKKSPTLLAFNRFAMYCTSNTAKETATCAVSMALTPPQGTLLSVTEFSRLHLHILEFLSCYYGCKMHGSIFAATNGESPLVYSVLCSGSVERTLRYPRCTNRYYLVQNAVNGSNSSSQTVITWKGQDTQLDRKQIFHDTKEPQTMPKTCDANVSGQNAANISRNNYGSTSIKDYQKMNDINAYRSVPLSGTLIDDFASILVSHFVERISGPEVFSALELCELISECSTLLTVTPCLPLPIIRDLFNFTWSTLTFCIAALHPDIVLQKVDLAGAFFNFSSVNQDTKTALGTSALFTLRGAKTLQKSDFLHLISVLLDTLRDLLKNFLLNNSLFRCTASLFVSPFLKIVFLSAEHFPKVSLEIAGLFIEIVSISYDGDKAANETLKGVPSPDTYKNAQEKNDSKMGAQNFGSMPEDLQSHYVTEPTKNTAPIYAEAVNTDIASCPIGTNAVLREECFLQCCVSLRDSLIPFLVSADENPEPCVFSILTLLCRVSKLRGTSCGFFLKVVENGFSLVGWACSFISSKWAASICPEIAEPILRFLAEINESAEYHEEVVRYLSDKTIYDVLVAIQTAASLRISTNLAPEWSRLRCLASFLISVSTNDTPDHSVHPNSSCEFLSVDQVLSRLSADSIEFDDFMECFEFLLQIDNVKLLCTMYAELSMDNSPYRLLAALAAVSRLSELTEFNYFRTNSAKTNALNLVSCNKCEIRDNTHNTEETCADQKRNQGDFNIGKDVTGTVHENSAPSGRDNQTFSKESDQNNATAMNQNSQLLCNNSADGNIISTSTFIKNNNNSKSDSNTNVETNNASNNSSNNRGTHKASANADSDIASSDEKQHNCNNLDTADYSFGVVTTNYNANQQTNNTSRTTATNKNNTGTNQASNSYNTINNNNNNNNNNENAHRGEEKLKHNNQGNRSSNAYDVEESDCSTPHRCHLVSEVSSRPGCGTKHKNETGKSNSNPHEFLETDDTVKQEHLDTNNISRSNPRHNMITESAENKNNDNDESNTNFDNNNNNNNNVETVNKAGNDVFSHIIPSKLVQRCLESICRTDCPFFLVELFVEMMTECEIYKDSRFLIPFGVEGEHLHYLLTRLPCSRFHFTDSTFFSSNGGVDIKQKTAIVRGCEIVHAAPDRNFLKAQQTDSNKDRWLLDAICTTSRDDNQYSAANYPKHFPGGTYTEECQSILFRLLTEFSGLHISCVECTNISDTYAALSQLRPSQLEQLRTCHKPATSVEAAIATLMRLVESSTSFADNKLYYSVYLALFMISFLEPNSQGHYSLPLVDTLLNVAGVNTQGLGSKQCVSPHLIVLRRLKSMSDSGCDNLKEKTLWLLAALFLDQIVDELLDICADQNDFDTDALLLLVRVCRVFDLSHKNTAPDNKRVTERVWEVLLQRIATYTADPHSFVGADGHYLLVDALSTLLGGPLFSTRTLPRWMEDARRIQKFFEPPVSETCLPTDDLWESQRAAQVLGDLFSDTVCNPNAALFSFHGVFRFLDSFKAAAGKTANVLRKNILRHLFQWFSIYAVPSADNGHATFHEQTVHHRHAVPGSSGKMSSHLAQSSVFPHEQGAHAIRFINTSHMAAAGEVLMAHTANTEQRDLIEGLLLSGAEEDVLLSTAAQMSAAPQRDLGDSCLSRLLAMAQRHCHGVVACARGDTAALTCLISRSSPHLHARLRPLFIGKLVEALWEALLTSTHPTSVSFAHATLKRLIRSVRSSAVWDVVRCLTVRHAQETECRALAVPQPLFLLATSRVTPDFDSVGRYGTRQIASFSLALHRFARLALLDELSALVLLQSRRLLGVPAQQLAAHHSSVLEHVERHLSHQLLGVRTAEWYCADAVLLLGGGGVLTAQEWFMLAAKRFDWSPYSRQRVLQALQLLLAECQRRAVENADGAAASSEAIASAAADSFAHWLLCFTDVCAPRCATQRDATWMLLAVATLTCGVCDLAVCQILCTGPLLTSHCLPVLAAHAAVVHRLTAAFPVATALQRTLREAMVETWGTEANPAATGSALSPRDWMLAIDTVFPSTT